MENIIELAKSLTEAKVERREELTKNIEKIVLKNPRALDMEVITSKDDEGNGFDRVYFKTSIGVYNKDTGNFTNISQIKEFGLKKEDINAICLN